MNTISPKPVLLALSCIGLLALSSCRTADSRENIAPLEGYAEVAAELRSLIEHEMADKGLPAVSIALVDDQQVVWAQGFGFADAAQQRPATAATVYRVGSVSKLFTDIGIMQLVEKGDIDLDAPVSRYLPDFQPTNPFGTPITLRQLMAHRAGLVREPPAGHYFDSTGTTLAETVAGLNGIPLVYAPETRTKYSNAGIAVVGYVLEKTQGKPFAAYLQEAVLAPLGMTHSSFAPQPDLRARLAEAQMWSYDGRTFPAPVFELGMAPAGSMYATVLDLGRFMTVLFNRGKGVLRPETLDTMWTPQFAAPGAREGYGIGWRLSSLDERRMVGHGGAIYGFATQLHLLPDDKLGVVVVTALDGANDVMERIAEHALRLLLARRAGQPLPAIALPQAVDSLQARRLDGRYRAEDGAIAELVERNGRLWIWKDGFRTEVKSLGDSLVTDGRLAHGTVILPGEGNSLQIDGHRFDKLPDAEPAPLPPAWKGLIGEYGWDYNTLYLLEKDGQLHALIEWFFDYPLQEVSADTFAFPDYGLYHGERLVFQRNTAGQALAVEAAGIRFDRRPVGLDDDATFKIKPVKPVAELRAEALTARPPVMPPGLKTPDLVELITLDTSLHLDIRYATTNNFMGAVFYEQARAFMQRPAAEALVRVHLELKKQGYGLLIHDAYRPWYVTKMFFDATPEDQKIFVADPAQGSIHNRGAAVDLTMYELGSGRPVQMVSTYDEFSERAFPDYPGGASHQRWLREFLRDAMEEQGFQVYPWEWWHFNYRDAAKYPVLNLRFEEIDGKGQ